MSAAGPARLGRAAAASAAAISSIAGLSPNTGLASSASPGPRCPIRAIAASSSAGGVGRQRADAGEVAFGGQRAQRRVVTQCRCQLGGLGGDAVAFHDHADPGHPGPRVLDRRRGDAGVDQPQRREDPALVNPVAQQPNSHSQAGVRQQAQLRGIRRVLLGPRRCRPGYRLADGALAPVIGPRRPLWRPTPALLRPTGADQTAVDPRPAVGRPRRRRRRLSRPSRAAGRRRRRWPTPRRRADDRTPRWPCSPIRRRRRRPVRAPGPSPGWPCAARSAGRPVLSGSTARAAPRRGRWR